MTMVMSSGYFRLMRYLAQAFQTASSGGEFSVALDFRRTARIIHVQAPMGDVAVMADPVEELAAADVVVVAPVMWTRASI